MSRIGKKPISLPQGVEIPVKDNMVTAKGPTGTLSQAIPQGITVSVQDNQIVVERAGDSKQDRAYHGLTRALLANMVQGVSTGFERKLELVGVGYRAQVQGKELVINIG